MKNILLVLLFITLSNFGFSQSKNKFSRDIEKFDSELISFLKTRGDKGKSVAKDFLENFDSFNESEKQLIIANLNSFYKYRIISLNYYSDFLNSVYMLDSVKTNSGQGLDKWLSLYNKYVEDKDVTRKNKEKFISTNYNVLSGGNLNPKSKVNWNVDSKLTLNLTDQIKYSFYNSKLSCGKSNDSLYLNNVDASFYPETNLIKVEKAKVYWDSNRFSKDSLYVLATNFDINSLEDKYKADSVFFTTKYFINETIMGKVEGKIESVINKKKKFPLFVSYDRQMLFENLVQGVNYNGGIMVRGNMFVGIGSKDQRAEMTFKSNNTNSPILISSSKILFTPKAFFAQKCGIDIPVKEYSISHPEVNVKYNIKDSKLTAKKGTSNLAKLSYYNSFSYLDMDIEILTWHLGADEFAFSTSPYNNLPYISSRYYEQDIYRKFQGMNSVNPLDKLRNMIISYDGMDYYSIETVADFMEMPKNYALHLLKDLAGLGYAKVEYDLDRVSFNERFNYLIDASRGNVDFDVLAFHSEEGKATNGKINLNTGKLTLLGVHQINVSNEKAVSLFPQDSVSITKNLDFKFDGIIRVKDYEFHGTDYSFNYDDYKIDMNGNQRMEFYTRRIDRNTQKTLVYKVFNPIDSIRGQLLIDVPTNKSGKIKNHQYPIFNNTREAYVFYDRSEIKDSVYGRDDLYVKLNPFELDSLNTVSSDDIALSGMVHTSVFPDFEYELAVQPDFSLGFVYETDDVGLSLYNKAQYRDVIILNMKGLNGLGRVRYHPSIINSGDILFYPDSLISIADEFELTKVDNDKMSIPNVLSEDINVAWTINNDSMVATSVQKPFYMYDKAIEYKGELILKSNKLLGNGVVDFETAGIKSDEFNFTSDELESEKLDFGLRDNKKAKVEFDIKGAYGKIDLTTRQGHFLLKEKDASVTFIENNYMAYINDIKWDIDNKVINLKSTDKSKIPWFISLDPSQDSLRFRAKSATYNLVTNELIVADLAGIEVADAFVYPSTPTMSITGNGVMEKFDDAKLIIGVGKGLYQHTLTKASVNITSSKEYKASAEYQYIDIDKIKHPIILDDISVGKDSISIAKGTIPELENFMLNPYFGFSGNVEITGNSPYLKLNGEAEIQNYCESINTSKFPINDFINSDKVILKVDKNNPYFKDIFTGFYTVDNVIQPAFLTRDKTYNKTKFASATGIVTFNDKEACYEVKAGKDSISGVELDMVSYYNDECRVKSKGNIVFNSKGKTVSIKSYGTVDFDMNTDEIKANLVLGMNFKLDRLIMRTITERIKIELSEGVIEQNSELQNYAFSRLQNKIINKTTVSKGGFFKTDIPEELDFTILLTDLEMQWDMEDDCFVSSDKISIHNFNGVELKKIFNGKVVIRKGKVDDEITIYFINERGRYYYLRYRNDVVSFYSNQKDIMSRFDELSSEKRSYEINGAKYMYKKESEEVVEEFIDFYM
ncbi:MAG: hypothetical protein KAG96_05575 [Ichthyobacteriaceae bacterium]|nr:hypothetical protein [Ichthyobacteriaceae bacterium]